MNRLIVTDNTDPWHNLALEEHLFDTQGDGVTLYLWQNRNTVVVGRNQNAWRECRVHLLESEGGKLARRSSGGGAVYHDLGNLNFTFILPRADYDLARQLAVLQRAAESFGLKTEVSGRNDVLLDGGAKFSGNAFRFSADTALHHGTILIDADMDKLSRYLSPPDWKLAAKGIQSVRARVCNLGVYAPGITARSMTDAMADAFCSMYGGATPVSEQALDTDAINALAARYASWDWRFGKTPRFDVSYTNRFDWGEVEMLLHCVDGRVQACTVFSDAMDATLADTLSAAVKDAPFSPMAIAERVRASASIPDEEREAIAIWLAAQSS